MSRYLADRTWMYKRQHESKIGLNDEFKAGVEEFLKYASSQPDFMDGKLIKCPCVKCHNRPYKEVDLVRKHLYLKGFVQNYNQWTAQGEPLFPQCHPSFGMEVGEGAYGNHFEHRQRNLAREMVVTPSIPSFDPEDSNPDLRVHANSMYGTGPLASEPSVNSKAPPPAHSATDPPTTSVLTMAQISTMMLDLQRQIRELLEMTQHPPAPAGIALSANPTTPATLSAPPAPHVDAPAPPAPILSEAMQQMVISFLADFMRRQQYQPPPPTE